MLAGEVTWCIGRASPRPAEDLASLKTAPSATATWVNGNGQKVWTSFGAKADYRYLICRTSSDGPKHQGIPRSSCRMSTPHRDPAIVQT